MKISKWIGIVASLVFIGSITSCGMQFPDPAADSAPTRGNVIASASTMPLETLSPVPTFTVAPTSTSILPTRVALATWTPPPFQALDGLRAAYIVDGDLYVQDSGRPAVQLTFDQGNANALLSDDGQKIVFICSGNQLCSINADGSQKQAIVTPELLSVFDGKEYSLRQYSSVFIPGTHRIILSIDLGLSYEGSISGGIFLVDADTGEIQQLRDDADRFFVSPDGKKIAIETIDHIDLITSDGQMLRHNLLTHEPIDAYYGIWWAELFWVRDSSEVVVLVTDIPPGAGVAMIRTIWRYPLDGGPGIEIKLDPPSAETAFSVSPDGKWIAYSYTLEADSLGGWLPEAVTWDSEKPVGVYLGNLQDGASNLVYSPPPAANSGLVDIPSSYGWHPNSLTFTCDNQSGTYFMNIEGGMDHARFFEISVWIDNTRYLTGFMLGEIGNQDTVQVIELLPGTNVESAAFVFLEH